MHSLGGGHPVAEWDPGEEAPAGGPEREAALVSRYRNYVLLLASQFIGAFGDNAILAVILGQLTFKQEHGLITASQFGAASAVYTSLLFVPYVLLAPLAGFLNDRFPKTRWLMGGNLIKVIGTALAAVSVWAGSFWQGLGYLIVGVGGCVYSPAKYGVLPEILASNRLVKANGMVEFLTIVAILTGYIGGAKMIDALPVLACYAILFGLYTLAFLLNALMTRTPAHPEVQLGASVDSFFQNFGDLLESPRLMRVLCGTGLFWVCGAVMKMNFPPWGFNVLHLQTPVHITLLGIPIRLGINTQIALLGLWLSLGIMIGAVLAGQLHRVGDLRRVRPYGWLMATLLLLLGLVKPWSGTTFLYARLHVILLLVFAGVAAGLFLIPLDAALQAECHPDKLGKTIATQNFVDNLAMVAAGGLVFIGNKARLDSSSIFLCLAVVVATVVIVLRIPPKEEPLDERPEAFEPDI